MSLEKLYASHVEYVRRCLVGFGAAPADLDDLVQEVFLVVHDKHELVVRIDQPDLWLREISRKVVAAYRRRAHRRHEVSCASPSDLVRDPPAVETLSWLRREDEARLHLALGELDEEERDLLALHSGSLPLVEVAALLERDRKTVSKRLKSALHHLQVIFGRSSLPERRRGDFRPPPSSGSDPQPLSAQDRQTQLLLTSPTLTVGLLGAVVIAVWPGQATLEGIELIHEQFEKVLASGLHGFAYLAIVEATARPPPLEARQRIVQYLELHASHIEIYATALQGGLSWIARPIMTGMAMLARPPFPMEYFSGTSAAARWLSREHDGARSLGSTEILRAAESLRELAQSAAEAAGAGKAAAS